MRKSEGNVIVKNFFTGIFGKKKNKVEPYKEPVQQQTKNQHITERDKPFDGYRMIVDFEREQGEKYYFQPNLDRVCEVINQMGKGLVNFVILEHSKCLGGCTFVQCMWGENGVYQVEAQVRRRMQDGVLCSQYRKFTENAIEVKNIFGLYLIGEAPNIRDWEHMDYLDFYE